MAILQLCSQLQMFSQLTHLQIIARDNSHVTLQRRASEDHSHLTIGRLPQAHVQLLLESSILPPVDHLTLQGLEAGSEDDPSPGVLAALSRLAELWCLTLMLDEAALQRWSAASPFPTLHTVTLQCIPRRIGDVVSPAVVNRGS